MKFFLSIHSPEGYEGSIRGFDEIVLVYTKKLYLLWKLAYKANGNLRIIDFQAVEQVFKKRFKTTWGETAKELCGRDFNDLKEFHINMNKMQINHNFKRISL